MPGTNFIDCLAAFEADPETRAIIMFGEIGGSEEEKAAEFIASQVTKPVVAYIAGVTAPPGKKMGHAGAIISGSQGTAQAKMAALADAGVHVVNNPTEAGEQHGGDRQRPVTVDDAMGATAGTAVSFGAGGCPLTRSGRGARRRRRCCAAAWRRWSRPPPRAGA